MKKYFILILLIVFMLGFCKKKDLVNIDPSVKNADKKIYQKARKYMKRDPEKARLLFKEVLQIFPDSIYAKKAKLGIADSYFREKDSASLLMAASEYQDYVNLYPRSPDAVYAKYQIAICYYKQRRKPGRDQRYTKMSIKAFESLIKQYPGTEEAKEAEKKIKIARGILAKHYFLIGYYNYKFKAFKGAINRFKQVMEEYPDFKLMDKLFYFAGKSYYKLKDYKSAISFFQRIVNSYPKSKYAKKSKKWIKSLSVLIKNQKSVKK